jgi:hypothetical protein
MPRPRKETKPRKAKAPDLNREVANALGAVTGTEAPKPMAEDPVGSDEARARAELARAIVQAGIAEPLRPPKRPGTSG